MNKETPKWGYSSRFFIPNEDARMVCKAIGYFNDSLRNPIFVGGSGMILLEATRLLPAAESVTYLDISSFQVKHFNNVLRGLERSSSPDIFRQWFILNVYPLLKDHFIRYKNRHYEVDDVVCALYERFGLSIFFKTEDFLKAKSKMQLIRVLQGDLYSYLTSCNASHDFVYLSNVTDYMTAESYSSIFLSAAKMDAIVYLLVTDACKHKKALMNAWENAGYDRHKISKTLTADNQGLGSAHLNKSWNRKGEVCLLIKKERRYN